MNPALSCHCRTLDEYRGPAFILRPRDTVELGGDIPLYETLRDAKILRIVDIIENFRNGECFLRGWKLLRCNQSKGKLDNRLNEVFMTVVVDDDDPRGPLTQGMEIVSVSEVFRKRKLIITNSLFPTYRYRDHTFLDPDAPGYAENKQSIERCSELVCRWVSVRHYESASNRQTKQNPKQLEHEMRRITESEADPEYRTSDPGLTIAYIGRVPQLRHFYTFGDAFCGCGGTSIGAGMAGLTVLWGFDFDPNAAETYILNVGGADVYCKSIDRFLVDFEDGKDYHVDILHISPPCQPYSPMNTNPNEELNAANHASLLAVQDLVARVKPRIITLEETSGLLDSRHEEWFHKLINMLTSNNYSCRWKVQHLDRWECAQKRKRLIMYASCPGGVLPRFPEPTHGPGTGRTCRTIREALAPLDNVPAQAVHANERRFWAPRTPYPSARPLQNLITTAGTPDWHPSGRRPFNLSELGLLQGFPVNFRLPLHQTVTALRRQIGNAFPPCSAKFFLEQAALTLEDEDVERFAEYSSEESEEPIVID